MKLEKSIGKRNWDMKNLNYEEIKKIFNKKIFENSKADLIKKLASSPERYIGLFRPTKPKTKLIQNITQSHEIKFGDAFEILIEKSFKNYGYNPLEKKLPFKSKYKAIDQLFEKDNKIIFIEQKIRDDHDSSKKSGQISNFEDKINVLLEKYKENQIKAYFYFIDPDFHKNQNFYKKEIEKLTKDYEIEIYLCYGEELFEKENIKEAWNDIIKFLLKWKKELPEFPELNFDKEAKQTFEELKDLPPKYLRKILENQEIIKEIFPIIFPEKKILRLLKEYYITKKQKIYQNLAKKLEKVIK